MKDIEEILKKYPYIAEDIANEQKELNKYIQLQIEARDTLKGQALTGMPHGSNVSDPTYQQIEKIIDQYQALIDEYIKKINDLLDLKKRLDKVYATLHDEQRRVLLMKYNKNMGLRQIGRTIYRDKDYVYKMLRDAKEQIKKVIM